MVKNYPQLWERERREKLGRNINVQPTAIAPRRFRSKGKGAARTGRRLEDQEPRKPQIVLDKNDDLKDRKIL